MSKRVLIAAYYFPPLGMGGVQRPLYLASGLARLGWDIVVLTSEVSNYPAMDQSLLNELDPSVRVVHVETTEPSHSAQDDEGRVRDFVRRLAMLPDSKILNLGRFKTALTQICETSMPDVIVTTSPPPSIHALGLHAQRNFYVRWIADFRDVWLPGTTQNYLTPLHAHFNRHLKQRIIERADRVVVVSGGHEELIEEGNCSDKVTLVTNGYDERVFREHSDNVAVRDDLTLTLAYAGTLNELSYVDGLFRTLNEISRKRKLRVRLCGVVAPKVRKILDEIDQSGMLFEFKGYLPHSQMIEQISSCGATLLTLAHGLNLDCVIPGKTFELLRLKRPLIAAVPRDQSAWKLLQDFSDVTLIDSKWSPDSMTNLESAFQSLHPLEKVRSGIDAYSWDHISGRYDAILRELSEPR